MCPKHIRTRMAIASNCTRSREQWPQKRLRTHTFSHTLSSAPRARARNECAWHFTIVQTTGTNEKKTQVEEEKIIETMEKAG